MQLVQSQADGSIISKQIDVLLCQTFGGDNNAIVK